MATTSSPMTALEMSRVVTESIAKAAKEGGDAAEARAMLARFLSGDAELAEAAGSTREAAPAVDALESEDEYVIRPNGEKYYLRKLGDHTDVLLLRKAREEGLYVLTYGPPGTGKTALKEAAFAGDEHGGLWTIQGTGDTEVADFVGGYTQQPDGTYIWVDGPLLLAMEAGGTLLVDEIALIDPKVLAVLYSVMDGRGEITVTANPQRGVVKAKSGFFVVGAFNPNAPGARVSEALISRFPLQFKVTTDMKLAARLGVPSKIRTAVKNLQNRQAKGEISWAPQLRELLSFVRVSKVAGEEIALRTMISGAPEMDRPEVQSVLSRNFAKSYTELSLD